MKRHRATQANRRPWVVYIVECADRSLYTGMTTDLRRRLEEHNSQRGARYTRSFGPVKLLWKEARESRSAAARRETQIKGWDRGRKLALIDGKKG